MLRAYGETSECVLGIAIIALIATALTISASADNTQDMRTIRRASAYGDAEPSLGVIPAKAGTQGPLHSGARPWVPAFAGMTTFNAIANTVVWPILGVHPTELRSTWLMSPTRYRLRGDAATASGEVMSANDCASEVRTSITVGRRAFSASRNAGPNAAGSVTRTP